jgi:phosphatidylglycerophosphate synthase
VDLKRLQDIFSLLILETAFFAVVLIFLVAEGVVPILSIILGAVLISMVVNRLESVNVYLQRIFKENKKLALSWGFFFVVGLPFILHDNPYAIHMMFLAGLYTSLAIGLDFQVGAPTWSTLPRPPTTASVLTRQPCWRFISAGPSG